MVSEFLTRFTVFTISKCESFVRIKRWKLILALLLPVTVMFLSFPCYERISKEYQVYWQALHEKNAAPFSGKEYTAESHEAKLTFRMTIPLIANLLGLKTLGILILQGLFGFLLFWVSAHLFEKITEDPVSALLLTLSLSFIWAGKCSFVELRGMFDGVALFFLVMSCYFRNPLLIFAGIFLASWTDERGLIASTLVFLFWWFTKGMSLKNIISLQTSAVIGAWIAYFLTRYWLIHVCHFKTVVGSNLGVSCFIRQMSNMPGGIWTALEGNWILVLIALAFLFKSKEYLPALMYALAILLLIVVAMAVIDITRSMAYIFPAMFIAVMIIQKKSTESVHSFRKIMLLATTISFIYPAYYFDGPFQALWTYPFPLYILRLMFGTGGHA
jgi:hypothetical protein